MREGACWLPESRVCIDILMAGTACCDACAAPAECCSEYLLSGAARRDQNEAYQHLSREENSLGKSEAMIDQMMNQGSETLREMGEQRSKLKGCAHIVIHRAIGLQRTPRVYSH